MCNRCRKPIIFTSLAIKLCGCIIYFRPKGINEYFRGLHGLATRPFTARPSALTEWWRHQRETFSASLAICAGNSPVPGGFPAQRPVMHSNDVFFDLRLNKRLSQQSKGWWFETLSFPLCCNCNGWTYDRRAVHVRQFSVAETYLVQSLPLTWIPSTSTLPWLLQFWYFLWNHELDF